eukprot:1151649-Pelagomonas_calceolata.AAC.6
MGAGDPKGALGGPQCHAAPPPNPIIQVVGAVGFNKKRLLIPDDLAPELTQLIQACWEEQPSLRPSFKSILGCGDLEAFAYVHTLVMLSASFLGSAWPAAGGHEFILGCVVVL